MGISRIAGLIHWSRIAIACLALLLSATAWADWKAPREALENRRVQGEFRIYYTQEGANSFPPDAPYRQRAGLANDMLDQLVSQLGEANRFYSNDLGLIPPLKNRRYRDVRSIDVQILDLGEKMGTTGDGIVTYHYLNFPPAIPAITISLSNRWRPGNLTPNHELFHAYQYGYTFFKNSWFLEGLARSMENAFRDAVPRSEPLPRSKAELQEVMSQSYGAESFWNRLLQLCDPSCKSAAREQHQARLCGGGLVRTLLEQFQSIDPVAARDRGIDPNDWPEDEQRSEMNNPYLVLGLRRAVESQCRLAKEPETRQFDNLLKQVELPGLTTRAIN